MDELEVLRLRLRKLDATQPGMSTPIIDGSKWMIEMADVQLQITKMMYAVLSAR